MGPVRTHLCNVLIIYAFPTTSSTISPWRWILMNSKPVEGILVTNMFQSIRNLQKHTFCMGLICLKTNEFFSRKLPHLVFFGKDCSCRFLNQCETVRLESTARFLLNFPRKNTKHWKKHHVSKFGAGSSYYRSLMGFRNKFFATGFDHDKDGVQSSGIILRVAIIYEKISRYSPYIWQKQIPIIFELMST